MALFEMKINVYLSQRCVKMEAGRAINIKRQRQYQNELSA
jgi:hypothetical protein